MRNSAPEPNAAGWQGQVESACARQGLHLTPLRRQVLTILAESSAPSWGLCDHRPAFASRRQAGRAADRLSHARFFSRARLRLQDREPQRLCALRASWSRPSRRAAPVREMRTERRDRGRQARPSVAGSSRARRLRPASADGRACGPMPGLRGVGLQKVLASNVRRDAALDALRASLTLLGSCFTMRRSHMAASGD